MVPVIYFFLWYLGHYLIILLLVLLLSFSFGNIFRLVPEFNPFINRHFTSCMRLVTLNLSHIRTTTLLNIKTMIDVKSINSIMYVVSVVIRNERRWVLYMMRFIMNTMTMRHCNRIPSGIHF